MIRIIHFMYFWQTPTFWMLESIEEFRNMNPDWEIRFWTDLPDDMPEHVIKALEVAPTPRFKADLVRYWILYLYGGVYCDIDTRPIRPMNDLLDKIGECDGFVTTHRDHADILDNYFLAAREPGLDFWLNSVERCCDETGWRKHDRYFGGHNAFPETPGAESILILDSPFTWEISDPKEYSELFTLPRSALEHPTAWVKHYRTCGKQTLPVLELAKNEELSWEEKEAMCYAAGYSPKEASDAVAQKPSPPPAKAVLVKLRNGDLYADPGGPLPELRDGFVRDERYPHRLRKLRPSRFNQGKLDL